jgi:transcriptional regulator with XRE-family HTH domain
MSSKAVPYPAIERRRLGMGISKRAIADYLNLNPTSVVLKLQGKREFTLTEARKLADLWGIPLDELAGRKVPSCPIYMPNSQQHMKEERL